MGILDALMATPHLYFYTKKTAGNVWVHNPHYGYGFPDKAPGINIHIADSVVTKLQHQHLDNKMMF